MESFKDRVYYPDCRHNDVDIDEYYVHDRVFGRFSEDGRSYTVTERHTPRPWAQYLCNDAVRSGVSHVSVKYN